MSDLQPYPKISAKAQLGLAGVRDWIAVEKVHGAHFAVVCDSTGVRPAKRRVVLGEELLDSFFGVSRIWPGIAVAAGRFADVLRELWGDEAVVTVYGELAGGHYPHPDVPLIPGVEPVQTGVWYAPDLHWLLFDAVVDTAAGRCWVSDRALREAAAAAGLTCVPVLARGPLNKLQELPREFETKVPAALGMPGLEGNLAEGYVLKPAEEWREFEAVRPLAKVKQDGFAEDESYAGSRPYIAPPEGAAGVPAWLLVQAAALLTPTRAAAAVSKLGPHTPAAAIADEIARDIVEEIAESVGGLDDGQAPSLQHAIRPGAHTLALFDAADRADSRGGLRS